MSNHHAGRAVRAVDFANQLDRSSEFAVVGRFRVTTRTGSVYTVDDDAKTIAKNDEPPQRGEVHGATFGGSMLMPSRLLVDAFMEFVVWDADDKPARLTSSLVTAIEMAP